MSDRYLLLVPPHYKCRSRTLVTGRDSPTDHPYHAAESGHARQSVTHDAGQLKARALGCASERAGRSLRGPRNSDLEAR
jgi:hypothetical protein